MNTAKIAHCIHLCSEGIISLTHSDCNKDYTLSGFGAACLIQRASLTNTPVLVFFTVSARNQRSGGVPEIKSNISFNPSNQG